MCSEVYKTDSKSLFLNRESWSESGVYETYQLLQKSHESPQTLQRLGAAPINSIYQQSGEEAAFWTLQRLFLRLFLVAILQSIHSL